MANVSIPVAVLEKLTHCAERDDMFARCEDCGAWFFLDEPEVTTVSDVRGCWYAATRRDADAHLCFQSQEYRRVGAYGMESKGRDDFQQPDLKEDLKDV